MKIIPNDHMQYFAGYLDAVTRFYTTGKILYASAVILISDQSSIEEELDARIIKEEKLKKMVIFEKDISSFLDADSKERMLFYLTEYFLWFEDFSDSCECVKYVLSGKNIPTNHLAYKLLVNEKHHIIIYLSESKKAASSKESLPTPRPLRTVRESFPSYGSSLSKEKSIYDLPQ